MMIIKNSQCLWDNGFAEDVVEGSSCWENPANCHDGFSVSFFYRPEYKEKMTELYHSDDNVRSLISSGG